MSMDMALLSCAPGAMSMDMEAQLKEEIHAYLAVEANNSHNACPPPTAAEDLSTK